jgi:hypothetical protein
MRCSTTSAALYDCVLDDDEVGAELVVVEHAVVQCRAVVAAEHDEGDLLREFLQLSSRADRGDPEDAVHLPVDQRVTGPTLCRGVVAAALDHDRLVAAGGDLISQAVEDVGEEGVADVRQEHADGEGAPAHGPGRVVGAVAQFVDGGLHLEPHGLADAVGVAQHFRHRCGGDLGVLGHVGDGHSALPVSCDHVPPSVQSIVWVGRGG